MSKNILLSTTRMWNCGDDFIAFGVRNILDQCLGESCNYIAYNRNPDLHFQRTRHNSINIVDAAAGNRKNTIDLSDYLAQTNWVFDNSWHPRNALDSVSAVIFAGTPEWFGPMVRPLTEALNEQEIPVLYLGVGGFEGRKNLTLEKLSPFDQTLLRKAELITVRDEQAGQLLHELKPVLLPCPALFSNRDTSLEKTKRGNKKKIKIALSTQPDKSVQPPSSAGTYQYTLDLFKALIGKFDCEVVCHYVDEIGPLSELGIPVKYSYDARDYFEIYNQYDLLVTTRVHGAGAAASLGVPSFVISHSARSSTVKGFKSELISLSEDSIDDVVGRIEAFNIKQKSDELKTHKEETFKQYERLLRPLVGVV
ncbi:MAG: hypothetical protein COA71_06590 [SAR86 cluster bacterium]|uniref:Polysaccharide pyruvyl transferase domain-containing protein n=1 Tax=SAR86 cluster bacterium TaxID=2030880 RepID=A0A2A5CCV2_9GAMM|nr:polysaccharide pyruvyl transferase family protein [Gammaproteobacteria bacterium AH-315-E17]PCJ41677.1 MAG: hypothetical protein COA71_06590 [SAR86 cluster bacterium]